MSRARDLADRVLHNRTHEDTDGGRESIVTFKGEQSGGEISTLAQIQASHDGTADDEKADLIFKTNDGSDGASPTERLRIDSAGTSLFAEDIELVQAKNINFKHQAGGTVRAKISADSSDNLTFGTGSSGTERMRIDTDGKLLLNRGDSGTTIQTNVPSGQRFNQFDFKTGDVQKGAIWTDDTTDLMGYYVTTGWGKNFYTGGAERMRITSDGKTLIGKTSHGLGTTGTEIGPDGWQYQTRDGTMKWFNRLNSQGAGVIFGYNGTTVGNITINSSSTAYNTSSDYRLKENVTDISDGITRVKQLKPSRFNFIAYEDKTVDGFLAHETATVVPEAVTGTKDELEVWSKGEELPDGVSVGDNKLDDNGNTIPLMQGIDQSKIVPLLTAALQEAIAKIETLETENTAIKARLDALEAE